MKTTGWLGTCLRSAATAPVVAASMVVRATKASPWGGGLLTKDSAVSRYVLPSLWAVGVYMHPLPSPIKPLLMSNAC